MLVIEGAAERAATIPTKGAVAAVELLALPVHIACALERRHFSDPPIAAGKLCHNASLAAAHPVEAINDVKVGCRMSSVGRSYLLE